jgi:hypothetical protein
MQGRSCAICISVCACLYNWGLVEKPLVHVGATDCPVRRRRSIASDRRAFLHQKSSVIAKSHLIIEIERMGVLKAIHRNIYAYIHTQQITIDHSRAAEVGFARTRRHAKRKK